MSARFRSTAAGKPFLQPLDLHVEPADLLEELGLPDQGVVVVATATIAEEGLGAVDELLLPLTDLDGVDPVRLGELGEGLVLLGGLDGDLGLEGSRMAFLCAGHDAPRDGTVTFDQFNIPSGPFLGVHYNPGGFPITRPTDVHEALTACLRELHLPAIRRDYE